MGQPSKNRQVSVDPLQQKSSVENILKTLAVCSFLFLMVVVVYFRTVQHEFIICDDDINIYNNPHVNSGLTWENVKWSLTGDYAGNWFPLTWLSHMTDCEINKTNATGPNVAKQFAGGHHATSFLLHAISSVVLFLAIQRMTGAFWCSAFVAAMFALHPLRVESVAWATERKDVLSGLFWMLTLLAYGGYARRPSVGRYLAVVGFFALGLMSKSMLVTLPCVLLLLDIWPLRRWRPGWIDPPASEDTPPRFAPQSLQRLIVEKLPLFVLAGAVCAKVIDVQRSMGAMTMVSGVTGTVSIANAAVSYIAYLWMTIWPANLAFFYPHPAVLGEAATARLFWQAIAAGVLLVAITLLILWNVRRRPYLAVGWFWYLGTMIPVIGLVQVGAQARADRYTYIPTIGIAIMLAWGAAELTTRWSRSRTTVAVAAGLVVAAWTVLTAVQVSYWQNSQALFQEAIDATNDNYFAYNHLGLVYHNRLRDFQYDEAMRAKRDEQFAQTPLGRLRLEQLKDFEKAEELFAKAVAAGPSYDAAQTNLGGIYLHRKDFANAIKYFRGAVEVNPYNSGHRQNLGSIYLKLGRPDEAETLFRAGLELKDDPEVRFALGKVLLGQGKGAEAVAEWKKIIDDDKYRNAIVVLDTLAAVLATHPDASIRNGQEALEFAGRANDLANNQAPELLCTLAAAYAETGQFPLAVETARKAAAIAVKQNRRDLAKIIETHISLYEDNKPRHDLFKPAPSK